MAARSVSKASANSFQARFNLWLAELAKKLTPAEYQPNLSPLKKDKHLAITLLPATSRVAMRLLAEALLKQLFGNQADPAYHTLTEAFFTADITATERRQSESSLPLLQGVLQQGLNSGDLAMLNLENLNQRRRQGSYYTSLELARYISHQTLTPSNFPVLDPACGAGAFLLVALDILKECNPTLSGSELLCGKLYGVDIAPEAVLLCRLTLLCRLLELDGSVTPNTLLVLAAQIRVGNALVGEILAPALPPDLKNQRAGFYKVLAEKATTEEALPYFLSWEASLYHYKAGLRATIAGLPIFDHPLDGASLAQTPVISWQAEFPEVFAQGGFGAVLGNPPYLGFNDYSGIEKAYFARQFAPIYNLKNDLLYYFIFRSVELLREGGKLGLVTSRFWKEAVYAAGLRQWLACQLEIEQLEDHANDQLFADANIDSLLLFARKTPPASRHQVRFAYNGTEQLISQERLKARAPWSWLRRQPAEQTLIAKIAEQSRPLGEVAQCRTGVQTGLDRVFFLTPELATQLELEPELLRAIIKNSDISPGKIAPNLNYLLVPPANFSPQHYPMAYRYLARHQEQLERRLRYKKAFPFYELQWARESQIFEAALKLVTPYKAPHNTFALDDKQRWFSTDVIAVAFPAEWDAPALQAAELFLNSKLATFYFRALGKPVGGGQWDYYANPVKKIAFPNLSPAALYAHFAPFLNEGTYPQSYSQNNLEIVVCDLFNLTPAEFDLIL